MRWKRGDWRRRSMEDEWRGEWEKRRKMSGDVRRSRIG